MRRFVDRAADFVPAVERVFGAQPRVLDGSRAVLVGDVKLSLEAGERELWLIRMYTHSLEHRIAMVEVRGDIEHALLDARGRCSRGMSAREWETVVGLEIHVQLKTRTKMFCRCEVALLRRAEHAHVPGLSRASRRAAGRRTGRRSSGRSSSGSRSGRDIADEAIFARKNYFYPDNPKGYQISQYDRPLCVGRLAARSRRGRRPGDPLRPRASRGGRREDDSRRRRGRDARSAAPTR